ncbi:unnamed protein product [Heligmosomoides polygyrus]|uniref:Uncharacterized protein n=1 Tax=Heligmosomoides polygyrus TaxID=6339 RepID=A0A183FP88_HELPZ|nr:unnamed protein product [Heligmosomoides polygyrus]
MMRSYYYGEADGKPSVRPTDRSEGCLNLGIPPQKPIETCVVYSALKLLLYGLCIAGSNASEAGTGVSKMSLALVDHTISLDELRKLRSSIHMKMRVILLLLLAVPDPPWAMDCDLLE